MIKSALQSSLTNDVKYRSMSAGAVPSSEYLITSTVLTQAEPSVTFDVSSLSGTYRHLQLVTAMPPGAPSRYGVRFNGASSLGNYAGQFLYSSGSSVAAGGFSGGGGNTNAITTAVGDGSLASSAITDILDPFSTTKNTTVRSLTGTTGIIVLYSGIYLSTSSLTSILVSGTEGATGNFPIGSRFSLYGVTA